MFREVVCDDDAATDDAKQSYAFINYDQLVALARAMPDAKSAVLLCLAWKAARQSRLQRGEQAGEPVARLSAGELAELTAEAVTSKTHTSRRRARNIRFGQPLAVIPSLLAIGEFSLSPSMTKGRI